MKKSDVVNIDSSDDGLGRACSSQGECSSTYEAAVCALSYLSSSGKQLKGSTEEQKNQAWINRKRCHRQSWCDRRLDTVCDGWFVRDLRYPYNSPQLMVVHFEFLLAIYFAVTNV